MRRRLLLISTIALCCFCCASPTEYPISPNIELLGLKYIDASNPASQDTLAITLNFTDGDGDLGLSENGDYNPPYNEKKYAVYRLNSNGSVAEVDSLNVNPYKIDSWSQAVDYEFAEVTRHNNLFWVSLRNNNLSFEPGRANNGAWGQFFPVNYAAKRINSAFSSSLPPYSCRHWEIVDYSTANNVSRKDTLYVKYNPNTYNIFIDIFTKDANGNFSLFDLSGSACIVNLFNGRFPILSKDMEQKNPLTGRMRYALRSSGFDTFFRTRILKLKITIQDRALHRSNTIETPEFTLQSIK